MQQKQPIKLKLGLFIIGLLLVQLACNLPISAPAQQQPQNVTIRLKPLVTQNVAPSAQEQSVTYLDQVNVILPGDLLQTEDTLVISSSKNTPPPPSAARKLLGAFDISLGDQHSFDKPIRLEISYDPKALKSNTPAADQLTAAFWDTDNNQWMTVPSTVDEQQHKIIVMTDHLSLYAYFNWAAGYSVYPYGHFRIIYDKKKVELYAGSYQPVVPHGSSADPDFVIDVGDFFETAYQGYQSAGYSLPEGEINVEIQAENYSEYGTLSGIIHITALAWGDKDELRQDCAHELFHAIQLKALGVSKYRNRQWWADATADYAADKVAYGDNRTGKMGVDIKPKYLETTITSNKDFHAYSTSHFISWLVDTQQVGSFKAIWDEANRGGDDVLATLKKAFGDDHPLGLRFSEFALFFIFDANSPGSKNKVSAISTDIASETDTLTPDMKELEKSFSVDYYTAKLWAVQSAVDADVLIERIDKNNGSVWVVAQNSDSRGASQTHKPELMTDKQPISMRLAQGDYLYLMLDNTSSSDAQAIDVRISLLNYPSGQFTLTLYADTGCDAGLINGGGYNNNNSVLHNLPVVIKGTNVTMSYDKTTGMKHLVASGSGSIDAKGTLTLNFDITYTLTRASTVGTETAQGTITADWDNAAHQWVGKGSGPISVNYPVDTEGGLESWFCSANINKGKIDTNFPFVDVDR